MNIKLISVLTAVLMLSVAGIVVIDADESDAWVETTGEVSVDFYNGTWKGIVVDAYDVCKAIKTAANKLSIGVVIDDRWEVETGGIHNPNLNYGVITSVAGETNVKAFVYKYTGGGSWIEAEDSLGWYRPFQDYHDTVSFPNGNSAGTASVIIVYGNVAVPDLTNRPHNDLVEITHNEDFNYMFKIKDTLGEVSVPDGVTVRVNYGWGYVDETLTTAKLIEGVEIYGYGSDMYLALIQALSRGPVGMQLVIGENTTFVHAGGETNPHYEFYSWMHQVLGKGQVKIEGDDAQGHFVQYKYWNSATSSGYMNFTLGYYSKLDGAYNDASGASFMYILGDKYYPQQNLA